MTGAQKFALAVGLSAFVFVVVCPLTVTPTAVTKSPPPVVALIVLPTLSAPELGAAVLPLWERPVFTPERRLDTLCARLC
jgi:hypothetical protein